MNEFLLAIDIGNKNTKLGVFQNTELIKEGKTPTHYILNLKAILKKLIGKQKVRKAIISSVVPSMNILFSKILETMGISPIFINGNMATDFKLAYKSLGPDRIANLYYAREILKTPFCVIDMGTATTIDVVNNSGEHIGGLIIPGITTGVEALTNNTELLPKISLWERSSDLESIPIIGKTTEENIKVGVYWGEVYRIKGILEKISKSFKSKLSVIVTGGGGKIISKELNFPYSPDLTLKGLNIIGIKYL